MVDIPPFKLAGGTTNQEITGNIQGSWYPYVSVSVVTAMGVLLEDALLDIEKNHPTMSMLW